MEIEMIHNMKRTVLLSLAACGILIMSCTDYKPQIEQLQKEIAALEERLGIKAGECTEDGFFSIESCRCLDL